MQINCKYIIHHANKPQPKSGQSVQNAKYDSNWVDAV